LDSECNDSDECTTDSCITEDACTGECSYTPVEGCGETQDECVEGQIKCENNKQFNCEIGPFDYLTWILEEECDEGCCESVCCEYENGGLIGTPETTSLGATGGLTGLFVGVPGGVYLPVGIVALFALIAVFFLFYKKK
jgi:hypothetical protein